MTDFFDMLRDVQEHVRTVGPVRLWDDPLNRKLGYETSARKWEISLTELKHAAAASKDNPERLALLQQFSTVEGRRDLVSF